MIDVSRLVIDVAAQKTVDASIKSLLVQVVAQNKDLAVQLAAAIATMDPAALQAVQDAINKAADDLETEQAGIVSAVTENTSAAPAPAPVEPAKDPASL